MFQKTIQIDESKCIGCGVCKELCKKNVIGMKDGKAEILRPYYCDLLGMCMPTCPTGAIFFQEVVEDSPCVVQLPELQHNWPVQMRLAPVKSPAFENKTILFAADCVAYCYKYFHRDFIKDNIVLIGCPELDGVEYGEKLLAILKENNVKEVVVARMDRPCCAYTQKAGREAIQNSGKPIPFNSYIITVAGDLL